MGKKLTLVVGSNRKGIIFSDIWKEITSDKNLDKIILVTQGKANSYKNRESNVVHIKLTNTGRSKAVNRGLQEVRTKLVGLTDDDCYLHKDWVSEAVKTLSNPAVSLVYGQTFAYQPEKNKGKICPCTFAKKLNKNTIVSHIHEHWTEVGFDNNAAIRKSAFEKIGGYKWWLGPGSIGKNAEDAEFILRALISKHKVAYNPSMNVYHNKWLTKPEWKRASQIYLSGGVAAYGFYGMQGVKDCQLVVKSYIFETIRNIARDFKGFLYKPRFPSYLIKDTLAHIYYLSWGLIIAFIFSKIIPIPERENVGKYIKHYNIISATHA